MKFPLPSSKKHAKEADAYVKAWMHASAQYVRRLVPSWDLLEDLYWNRRRLSEWGTSRKDEVSATNRLYTKEIREDSLPEWRADYTISVSPYVDGYVTQLLETIFAADKFFAVESRPKTAQGIQTSVEDGNYPTSTKLEAFLVETSNSLRFRTRCHEFLVDQAVFGTGIAKVTWLEEIEDGLELGPDGTPFLQSHVVTQGAQLSIINPARFLPDPLATSSNCQLWSGMGDRSRVSYEVLRSRFETKDHVGPYNLGRKEFLERWPDGGQQVSEVWSTDIKDDERAYEYRNEEYTELEVWEWQGKIHFSDYPRPTECICTVITDLGADSPLDGVLVRLQEAPALGVGLRTYLISHFVPTSGPFGMGLLERNLPLIWSISHAINQFTDAVRLCAIPQVICRRYGPAYEEAQNDNAGNVIYPGKIWPVEEDVREIAPFSLQVTHLDALLNHINMLSGLLDRNTSVPDVSRGVGGSRKSATEANSLYAALKRPIGQVLAELKENFLEPYGRLALAYFQRRVTGDQAVWVKGPDGVPRPVVLTEEEIRTGEYTVTASLDIQDQAKISKAQTLMQMIPMFASVQAPLLQMESTVISLRKVLEKIFQFLDIADASDILRTVDEQQKMALMGPPPGAQPPGPGTPPPGPGAGMEDMPNIPQDIPPEVMQAMMQQMSAPGLNGGPAGDLPGPLNDMFARLQMDAMNQGAVYPGMQGPA